MKTENMSNTNEQPNKQVETNEQTISSNNISLKLNLAKNDKVLNKKKLPRIYLYFIYFLVFSIIGWLIETAYSFYSLGHFTKRGFLYGPLCPIYGWGAVILIIFFSKYKKQNFKLFVYSAIIFSLFEYLVSFGMEALFALKWWDYTIEFMNLNGRISIFYSFAWGIIAILVINFIYPFFKKKINLILSKIPYIIQISTVYILFAIFLTDNVLSFIKYLLI